MEVRDEIVKALERMSEEDPNGFSSDILGVIQSLKAEKEELEFELIRSRKDLLNAKSEARKEFADRVKKKAASRTYAQKWEDDLDEVLAEMESERE